MNSSASFPLDAIDRAYARFAALSCARVIVGRLNVKFWSVMFFAIAATACFSSFHLTPFGGEEQPPLNILITTTVIFGVAFMASAHVLGATNHLLPRSWLSST